MHIMLPHKQNGGSFEARIINVDYWRLGYHEELLQPGLRQYTFQISSDIEESHSSYNTEFGRVGPNWLLS